MKQTIIPFIIAFVGLFTTLNFPTKPAKQAEAVQYRITEPTTALTNKVDTTSQAEAENPPVLKLGGKLETTPVDRVLEFLKGKKHRYTEEYLQAIYSACGEDRHCLYSIVAISGQESGFGTAGKANDGRGKDTNFWGFFKGGDRNYDPDQATMARVIGGAFNPNSKTYHCRIIKLDGSIDNRLARIYHGNDGHNNWVKNVSDFYKKLLDKN